MDRTAFLKGSRSIAYSEGVYLVNSASVVGKKEGEGPLGSMFDVVGADDMFGGDSWEDAESTLQKEALTLAIGKSGMKPRDIRYLFAGDLLGQSMATSFGVAALDIPLFGLYGACSTCGESLLIASMMVGMGMDCNCACVTSSHFCSAEKEFRYPLGYGNQRPLCATWTVTGSGAFVLSSQARYGCRAKIMGGTTGVIVDYGCKDSMNMGACMAPAAYTTLMAHFEDFQTGPEDYDAIITGDLGKVGKEILIDMAGKKGYNLEKNYMDCGLLIFDADTQNTNSGGSGCGCAASVLSAYILDKLEKKEWRKVLFMPTGALLSKTSFNEGKSIPAIAHCVILNCP